MSLPPSKGSEIFFRRLLTIRQHLTRSPSVTAILIAVSGGAAYLLLWPLERTPVAAAVQADSNPLPVDTIALRAVDQFTQERQYAGVIRASRESELSFERADRLLEVRVDQGDPVAEGTVLALLDSQRIAAQRQLLEAQHQEATALLDELVAGPRQETIAAQRATVSELGSQVELLTRQRDRQRELARGKATSEERLDEAELGRQAAEARLLAAQRQLEELVTGTRPEQIAAQRARLAQITASLRDIDIQLAECRLVAPYDGVITKRYLDEGTVVSPGEPVLRIIEAEKHEAWIGVPPSAAAAIQLGELHPLWLGNQETVGLVRAILPELDPTTRTQTVVLDLLESEPANGAVGDIVRMNVAERIPASGFWLPTTALTRGGRGLWAVLALDCNAAGVQIATRRDVEVLHTTGSHALVRGMLREGERIIEHGTQRVSVGQAVRIADRNAVPNDQGRADQSTTTKTPADDRLPRVFAAWSADRPQEGRRRAANNTAD